jgi:hypothetical protein
MVMPQLMRGGRICSQRGQANPGQRGHHPVSSPPNPHSTHLVKKLNLFKR